MNNVVRRTVRAALAALALSQCFLSLPHPAQAAPAPQWPHDSVIYTIYPSIFSPEKNFAGITAQLGRLKQLGVTTVWLMPVTPIGRANAGHPNVDSPYCVHDFYGVEPSYGSPADLHTLITTAHKLGLQVLLDEVLNHSSWDNALITKHPEFYVHSDGDPHNPKSVVMAFTYTDVAQFNYANAGLRAYMITMLKYWVKQYHIDGFRFDSANNPDGPNRKIPADFWHQVGSSLRQAKPNILLLEEGESPDLAHKPFSLDYGWRMYDAFKRASNNGNASDVVTTWHYQVDNYPAGMQHMSIQDDWDDTRDVNTFGGASGAQAAAVFNFTQTGVPLIYNGMEIGNAAEGTNPHALIDWHSGTPGFQQFYKALIKLRRNNSALQGGKMTWVTNSVPSQVLTYERVGGGAEYFIEVNLSSTAATGNVDGPVGSGWTEVSLPGMAAAHSATKLPLLSLPPKGFAIYRRAAH